MSNHLVTAGTVSNLRPVCWTKQSLLNEKKCHVPCLLTAYEHVSLVEFKTFNPRNIHYRHKISSQLAVNV